MAPLRWIHGERPDVPRGQPDILPVMEAAYLVILVITFVGIGLMSLYIVYKLFAGQR